MKWLRLTGVFLAVLFIGIGAKPAKSVWNVPGDFATLQEAVDDPAVMDGHTIRVGPGHFAGALLDKSLTIKGVGQTVIDDGPVHGSGLIQGFRLLAGSDGTTLSHLRFETDLSIMNGAAVDDVTVTQCEFRNSVQAVSNWRGSRWEITNNTIEDLRTRNGGGIGILVADFAGGSVTDNVVSHNTLSGTLHVDNAIGFNDFRGTMLQIVLTPPELEGVNTISRNFGNNRGHGVPPSLFGPGGN